MSLAPPASPLSGLQSPSSIGFHKRKPNGLPYKWPLLAEGQDPDALEARLAYHLHRLNLTGEPLREALKGKAYLATALSQGRASIDHDFITELAACLNIAADELLRDPTADEAREWRFYRASAQNQQDVLQRANKLWTEKGLTLRQASAAIGMKHPNVINAISGVQPAIFDWQHAQRLADAIDVAPPELFLPSEWRDDPESPQR